MSKWRLAFSSKLLSDAISLKKYRETTTQRGKTRRKYPQVCNFPVFSTVNVACERDFLEKIQGNCQPDVEKNTKNAHRSAISLCFLE